MTVVADDASVRALADAFLAALPDRSSNWGRAFADWARARGLNAPVAKAVKIVVLRERVFGAARFRPRRRR